MSSSRARTRTGCRHCVSCHRLAVCRTHSHGMMELWPAGLQDPTVYFSLGEGRLAYLIQQAAAQGPAAWRSHSVAAAAPCELRQRRRLPPLSVNVPLAAGYGIRLGEQAMFIGTAMANISCGSSWRRGASATPPLDRSTTEVAPPAVISASATPAVARSSSQWSTGMLCFGTPPRGLDQPAKRLRSTAVAQAASRPGSAAQAQQQSGHLIAASALGADSRKPAAVVAVQLSSVAAGSAAATPPPPPPSALSVLVSTPLSALFLMVRDLISPAPTTARLTAGH
ncbi:hypothetical protein ACK3TF_005830 [Chlorella vulgaris]